MKKTRFVLLLGIFIVLSSAVRAQSWLKVVEKAVNSVENTSKNTDKRAERMQAEGERTNPLKTEKSPFHEAHIGKIIFAKGKQNGSLEDESLIAGTLDLTEPSYFNVYLEDPLYSIKARNQKLEEYAVVPASFIRKYYINNELIASYTDKVDGDDFKQKAIFSDVLVPASSMDFEDNEMRIGVLAHVFSSLTPGTHTLKTEYVIIISTEKPNTTGSAATLYDNNELVVASGEVALKVDANSVNAYCKRYGRPKFGKGVLQGQRVLEQQVSDMIKSNRRHEPAYIYANDNWELKRGALDRVVARETRIYYVFRNDSGRCEMADFVINQPFDGQNYQAPGFGLNKSGPAFKFVCCQNY